jgi:hypothetical protein
MTDFLLHVPREERGAATLGESATATLLGMTRRVDEAGHLTQ